MYSPCTLSFSFFVVILVQFSCGLRVTSIFPIVLPSLTEPKKVVDFSVRLACWYFLFVVSFLILLLGQICDFLVFCMQNWKPNLMMFLEVTFHKTEQYFVSYRKLF